TQVTISSSGNQRLANSGFRRARRFRIRSLSANLLEAATEPQSSPKFALEGSDHGLSLEGVVEIAPIFPSRITTQCTSSNPVYSSVSDHDLPLGADRFLPAVETKTTCADCTCCAKGGKSHRIGAIEVERCSGARFFFLPSRWQSMPRQARESCLG